ncbi:uncharacterized protein LOC121771023 isoform X2 [Salvia splendens]|uniref:uncharacterized protein LOC121771023 isoform X2 n=1 Tax=Salvia splendens TaxID=180675 RepID=UPI001C267992|nr:uncharacterized protein LOC121771023 isoform X2 [Salvia splendens]
MAQEQQQHIVSSSDSERSRNVKLKKKIPQRGLGVAQLEKIRVEELMKKEVLAAPNAIGSVTDATPSPSPLNFRSSNTLCRSWTADHDHRNTNAAGFRPPVNLNASASASASASAAALPSVPHRFFRFQQPASPLVNPYSSSALHMEPPSNQNHLHCSNSYASSSLPWPEMVGMKRPYPFFLESLPGAHLESGYDELASCGSGYAAQKGPRNVYTRDGPSNSSTPSEQGSTRDDGRLDGDFLTLALPPPNSKHAYAIDDFGCQWPEDDERRQGHRLIASRSMEEPFNLFPARPESGGDKGEAIDLNLKL